MPRTIQFIYNQAKVPPNLQRHMLRAAAAAEIIIDHWNGQTLARETILRVLLLHDIGNIVKCEFDKHPELLEEELGNISYWRKVQEEYICRFGKDDHLASHVLASEFGLTEEELTLLDAKLFKKNDLTSNSSNYNLKVAAYVDQRIGPFGVLPLLNRLRDAQRRYKETPGSLMNSSKGEFLIDCAVTIEKQVMKFCTLNPEDINDQSIADGVERLRRYEM